MNTLPLPLRFDNPEDDISVHIPLSKGNVAIVDAVDGDLAEFKWYTFDPKHARSAYAISYLGGKRPHRKNHLLHRVIMGRILGGEIESGLQVDHINGNGLDNRRCNLRLATHAQNAQNVALIASNQSGFKGVQPHRHGYWKAHIWVDERSKALGIFDTAEDAAVAYNHAAKLYFGEFANFNEIPDWERIQPARHDSMTNSTGYPGVTRRRNGKDWVARITLDGHRVLLGYFKSPSDAFEAYWRASEWRDLEV